MSDLEEKDAKRNVPKLRFPGFTDPWEQRKLGEVAAKRTEKNVDGAFCETLTNSAERGVVSQLDYFDHGITNNASIAGYYVVRPDDFVYNPRISATAPCGPINRNRLNRAGVMSPLYTVFYVDETVDKVFLEHYFKTERWHPFMFLEGNSGARSDRFSIADSTFFKMPVQLPSLDEQRLIVCFLENLDHLITLRQRELEHTKELKRGLLQKMFPKEGSNTPEIRFPGFTDPWEQRKLGEVAAFDKGVGFSKDDFAEDGEPLFHYGRLYTDYECVVRSVDTRAAPQDGAVFSAGGEVVTPSSGETAEDIAIASAIVSSGIMLGGGLNIIRPYSQLDPVFLALSISNGQQHYDLARRAQGKSIVHLYNDDLAKSSLTMPRQIKEQQEIGRFFESFDSLITLRQRELDHVKLLKKALLQQMFV